MTHKIAVALSKGGVGKTTTAVSLAADLAQRGNSVLLIDLDTQGQAARALGVQPQLGITEVVSEETSAADAVCSARPRLWLLAGGRPLAGLKRIITRKEYGGERTLAEALTGWDEQFEYVIVDTAPGWDALTVNALFYASSILAPVSMEVLTLQGLAEFNQSIGAIQKYNPSLALKYILPTFFDRRVKKSDEILAQLRQHYPQQVCQPVRYSVRLSEAPGYGQTIFEYAPGSSGATDYANLTERILSDGDAQANS